MDALFEPLVSATGASLDQIKLISCMIISYPLGSVYVRIPSGHAGAKHMFSIVITAFYLLGLMKMYNGALQLLGSILAIYYIAKNVQGHTMPWIVFVFSMSHLMANHAIRVIYNLSYETVEITGPQMVLTMKLTTFAWNVWDGRRQAADLDKWQMQKRIVEFPSLLAFLGYCFYFPGFFVGPYLDFASYMSLVDESIFDVKGKDAKPTKRKLPSGRKRVAYRKFLMGLAFLGIYVTQGGKYNYAVSLENSFVQKPLLYRIALVQFCGVIERVKYYAIWTLTEGASILTGNGFSGYGPKGETLWNDARNVDILNIEFAPSFKVLLDSWNMKTNIWLRECVYKRVTPKGKKPGFRSSMMTFATSAIWHGCSGGYYITFIYGGFVQTAGRLCRANFRPLLLPPHAGKNDAIPPSLLKTIYDIVGTLLAVMCTNYAAMPFMLLTTKDSLKGWSSVGWYGFVIVFSGLAFFYSGGSALCKRLQAKRQGSTMAQAIRDVSMTAATPGRPLTVPPVDIPLEIVDKTL